VPVEHRGKSGHVARLAWRLRTGSVERDRLAVLERTVGKAETLLLWLQTLGILNWQVRALMGRE
jgi:hypothetical protein